MELRPLVKYSTAVPRHITARPVVKASQTLLRDSKLYLLFRLSIAMETSAPRVEMCSRLMPMILASVLLSPIIAMDVWCNIHAHRPSCRYLDPSSRQAHPKQPVQPDYSNSHAISALAHPVGSTRFPSCCNVTSQASGTDSSRHMSGPSRIHTFILLESCQRQRRDSCDCAQHQRTRVRRVRARCFHTDFGVENRRRSVRPWA